MTLSPTRLATVRRVQGLLQREADERCGVARGTFCRLEMGKGSPTQATIERLAHGLGVKPDDLAEPQGTLLTLAQQQAVLAALAAAEGAIEALIVSRTLPAGEWLHRRAQVLGPYAKAQVELDRLGVQRGS